MKKVVSVRLREDVVNKIDYFVSEMGLESRTDFLKQALDYYVKRKRSTAKGVL
ncbi:ribbon-helix-helix domain-containing protein [Sulfolobus acidocaldarius]|uniref:Conserved protein n=4 Tax=Sulfolobus acidocaldarius TaxID=2285 RepID=Q4J8F2_SULAC|nr:ribbon-helix-helix domain-containing protein [Sulfolobus acidocaldarius]AHC51831.1 CopG family transcripitonal regulator [Sulfolobus acidocaldarius SUSAZ]AAY80928.1 conserved protein [Sulfolobus acidocaldarius DSM 639]AGE71529.1 hypothetical protein SacN8_07845 [Sulfolobus acidocaldarius N8]AGE73802.1 hypothetical protein SacRon12I_07855 [Sulfolobus acidocaldarius Ron12/I]ALU30243.1 CopG family transcriptional regulator [Sulfolobus acidocaldarius]